MREYDKGTGELISEKIFKGGAEEKLMKFRLIIMGLGILYLCSFIFLHIVFFRGIKKLGVKKSTEKAVATYEGVLTTTEIPEEVLIQIAKQELQEEEIKLNYIKGELTEERREELEKIPFDEQSDFLDEIYKGILEKKINDYINLR